MMGSCAGQIRLSEERDISAEQPKDYSKYRWANSVLGGVQTALYEMRLKSQAGADHATIRLVKKCKRQSKTLNKDMGKQSILWENLQE